MPEPIDKVEYWAQRLKMALAKDRPQEHEHEAVFRCTYARWREIEERHREILARHIKDGMSVADLGCGWGRLVKLLPDMTVWQGPYFGVDLSPDFIQRALTETVPWAVANNRGGCTFMVGNLLELGDKMPLLRGPAKCPKCRGAGHGPVVEDPVNGPTVTSCVECYGTGVAGCRHCSGKGTVYDYRTNHVPGDTKCWVCNGSGRDQVSPRKYDWGILVSIRPMVKRNLGSDVWDSMEKEIRKVCEKLLYLEYDPLDEGSVE